MRNNIKRFNESEESISDVSCSSDDIKKWVDNEVGYYDECDSVEDAINDMLHDFKTHFLKIDYRKKFDKESELIKYFKSEWNQTYGNVNESIDRSKLFKTSDFTEWLQKVSPEYINMKDLEMYVSECTNMGWRC
jgi:hypothetical protein